MDGSGGPVTSCSLRRATGRPSCTAASLRTLAFASSTSAAMKASRRSRPPLASPDSARQPPRSSTAPIPPCTRSCGTERHAGAGGSRTRRSCAGDRNAPVLGAGEVETAADPDTVWVVLADIRAGRAEAPTSPTPCCAAPSSRARPSAGSRARPRDRLHRGVLGRPAGRPRQVGMHRQLPQRRWGGDPGRVRQRQRADDATGAELQASGKSRTAGRQVR